MSGRALDSVYRLWYRVAIKDTKTKTTGYGYAEKRCVRHERRLLASLSPAARQRPTETGEEAGEGASGWGAPGGGTRDPDAPDKEAAGYDEEGGDSKAMKLTLMEEVLLLGLKDREVSGVAVSWQWS